MRSTGGGWTGEGRLSEAIAAYLRASPRGSGLMAGGAEVALTYLAWTWRADGGRDRLDELDPVWVSDHLLRLPREEREEDARAIAAFLRAVRAGGMLTPEWDPVLADPRPAGRLLPPTAVGTGHEGSGAWVDAGAAVRVHETVGA